MKDKTTYLYYKIYNDILRQLKDGTLKIGNKVDREVDIAKKYGVSRSTVRKALESMTKMELIFRVKKGGTFVNGIPNIDVPQKIFAMILPFNETLHRELISGAQNTAISHNCFATVFDSKGNALKEREILMQLLNMDIDGIILYPCSNDIANIDLLYNFKQKNTPVVFLDRPIPCFSAPLVSSDNKMGLQLATQHLIDNGHTKIAFFALSNLGIITEKERLESYLFTLYKNDIPIRNEYILKFGSQPSKALYTSQKHQSFYYDSMIKNAADNLLKLDDRPTAIIFIHDMIAYRFYQMSEQLGYKIPQDFSAVGFDDSQICKTMTPALTSVKQDFFQMGSCAVDLICNSPKHFINSAHYIPTTLTVRQSVKNLSPL